MTGEVTLLGHVLAIGGVKEKTMGAKSYGIKTLIFPHANKAGTWTVDEISLDFVTIFQTGMSCHRTSKQA